MFFIKKITIILALIIGFTYLCKENNNSIIPNESIRIRVIANSNNIDDQVTKVQIKEKIEKELYRKLNDKKNITEARLTINNEIPNIKKIVSNELNNTSYSYSVNYGQNYFPEKTYKGINYDAGNYESLVVTLGKGNGNNWWCVLFPPLCMLDVKENNIDNVEYKSKVLEILNNYK